uniref:Uncharacterized protein n=1 Tax=Arundo donax TaxID=35708 RepID=A0A0A9FXA9_ARUDO
MLRWKYFLVPYFCSVLVLRELTTSFKSDNHSKNIKLCIFSGPFLAVLNDDRQGLFHCLCIALPSCYTGIN